MNNEKHLYLMVKNKFRPHKKKVKFDPLVKQIVIFNL